MIRARTALALGSALAMVAPVPAVADTADHRPRAKTHKRIDRALQKTFAKYRASHDLPKKAGILVHTITPAGTWTSTSVLPKSVGRNTHYRVASVSKTFTAAAVMLLHQRGKLDINHRVAANIPGTEDAYLPHVPDYDIPYRDQITIRQLLSHRAGVFDLWNDPIPEDAPVPYAGQYYNAYRAGLTGVDTQYTVDELAKVLSESRATFGPPDTMYKYSDTGYNLLTKIVQRVSGKPFAAFVQTELLDPMGLRETTVVTNAYDSGIPAPNVRGWADLANVGWMSVMEDNMSSQVGPGSVISTPSDIARWMSGLVSGEGPLKPRTVRTMTKIPAGNTTYALGLSTTKYGTGHSGAHPGYINIVQYDAKSKAVVVVLTPFIDYTQPLDDHLALLETVVEQTRAITGYPIPQ